MDNDVFSRVFETHKLNQLWEKSQYWCAVKGNKARPFSLFGQLDKPLLRPQSENLAGLGRSDELCPRISLCANCSEYLIRTRSHVCSKLPRLAEDAISWIRVYLAATR